MKAAANWAHDTLEDEHLAWLRRLPAERRVRIGDDLILVTHASPGSQTQGFDKDLDPSTTTERMSRTDARVICCGHTHMPEIREFGWKLIVNDGSAGYVFDGDPTASWALVTLDGDDVTAEIKRTEYDNLAVSNAISSRGLPGDVYRAATVRTGKLVR
jgi:predicted phosphodiesterase